MIGFLHGKIMDKRIPEVWLLVGGVGYRVKVGPRTFEQVKVEEETEFYIHTHLRQDALELFGFVDREELDLFELLLTVSGVGPKIALTVIGNQSVAQIERAVREADVAFFTRIPGLGKKGAQRIIVDLKSKIGSLKELDLQSEASENDDVTLALKQFGFKSEDIRQVMKQIDPSLSDQEKVKIGLKKLGRVKNYGSGS